MGFWPLCSIKMYVISALFAFMLVKNKLIFFICDVLHCKVGRIDSETIKCGWPLAGLFGGKSKFGFLNPETAFFLTKSKNK